MEATGNGQVTQLDQSECANPLASVTGVGKTQGASSLGLRLKLWEMKHFYTLSQRVGGIHVGGAGDDFAVHTHTHTHTHPKGHLYLRVKPPGRKTDSKSRDTTSCQHHLSPWIQPCLKLNLPVHFSVK